MPPPSVSQHITSARVMTMKNYISGFSLAPRGLPYADIPYFQSDGFLLRSAFAFFSMLIMADPTVSLQGCRAAERSMSTVLGYEPDSKV